MEGRGSGRLSCCDFSLTSFPLPTAILVFFFTSSAFSRVVRNSKNAFSARLAIMFLTSVSLQDNQTDSGMVLASEEFERIENRHRKEGAFRYAIV